MAGEMLRLQCQKDHFPDTAQKYIFVIDLDNGKATDVDRKYEYKAQFSEGLVELVDVQRGMTAPMFRINRYTMNFESAEYSKGETGKCEEVKQKI